MLLPLDTDRLAFHPFTLEDSSFILRLVNDPGWLQFIGVRNVRTEEQARLYLMNGALKHYQEMGFGFYVVQLKVTGEPIGMSGLVKRDGLDDVDIGYAFFPEYTGKGYALEAARSVLEFAKTELQLPKVVAITTPDNHRSSQLLEKLGLQFEKMVQMPPDNKEMKLFAIEWNEKVPV